MTTAPRLPNDEALDILRRLEPMLSGLITHVSKLDERVLKLDERVSKLENFMERADERGRVTDAAIAKLDGRMTELSARVPTSLQLISIMLAVNAGILSLGVALASALK
jgi:hypothetical protein